MSLHIYEFRFLGTWNSVIHRTQHRTIECVFYIEHRKYVILVIMLSISLVLTLFSFLLNINLYIFFSYIILILSHCVMLFWRENKIGNRPCLGETGWGRYTLCRIFLFLLLQSPHAEIGIHELYQCSLFIQFTKWIHSSENCATYYAFHMIEAK